QGDYGEEREWRRYETVVDGRAVRGVRRSIAGARERRPGRCGLDGDGGPGVEVEDVAITEFAPATPTDVDVAPYDVLVVGGLVASEAVDEEIGNDRMCLNRMVVESRRNSVRTQ